jgi:hypothetical protein
MDRGPKKKNGPITLHHFRKWPMIVPLTSIATDMGSR